MYNNYSIITKTGFLVLYNWFFFSRYMFSLTKKSTIVMQWVVADIESSCIIYSPVYKWIIHQCLALGICTQMKSQRMIDKPGGFRPFIAEIITLTDKQTDYYHAMSFFLCRIMYKLIYIKKKYEDFCLNASDFYYKTILCK